MARWQQIVIIFMLTLVSAAQTEPRDYSISLPLVRYAPDGDSATISFSVSNRGGAAVEASRISISDNASGSIVLQENLPALAAGEEREFNLRLPLRDLPAEDLFYRIKAGIDQYELAGSPIARNNEQLIRVNKADPAAAGGRAAGGPPPQYDLWLPIVNLGVNFLGDGIQLNNAFFSRSDVLLRIGLLLVALFCLWLLSLALRLIFRRPPKFEPWQPPYAVNNWTDPDSTSGRRQGWQFHAQNSSISAARAPDQLTVIKRLIDNHGLVFGAWSFKAIRSVQYDVYGRISRSEVVMPRKVIKALNRVAGRAHSLDEAALRGAVRPIAKLLSKRALSAIEKQNASLWLALDMRLEGITGEARIVFELYQYRQDAWQRIDQWAPELAQVGARLPEHFTFTLNGQWPGESYREFKRRLVDDVTDLLASLFNQEHQSAVADSPTPASDTPLAEPENAPAAWPTPEDDTDAPGEPLL